MFKKYFRSRTTTKLGLISRINCSSISRNICESTFRLGQLKKLQLLFVYYTTFTLTQNVWKSPKMSHLNFRILSFSTNFCPIKIDLSGNTVWPQASGFQILVIRFLARKFKFLEILKNETFGRFERANIISRNSHILSQAAVAARANRKCKTW